MKSCYGKCDRCVWYRNGGCSEWLKAPVEADDVPTTD